MLHFLRFIKNQILFIIQTFSNVKLYTFIIQITFQTFKHFFIILIFENFQCSNFITYLKNQISKNFIFKLIRLIFFVYSKSKFETFTKHIIVNMSNRNRINRIRKFIHY